LCRESFRVIAVDGTGQVIANDAFPCIRELNGGHGRIVGHSHRVGSGRYDACVLPGPVVVPYLKDLNKLQRSYHHVTSRYLQYVQAVCHQECVHCGYFYNVKRIGDFNAMDSFLNHGLYICPISKWDFNASPPAYKRAAAANHVTQCCIESLSLISPHPIHSTRLANIVSFDWLATLCIDVPFTDRTSVQSITVIRNSYRKSSCSTCYYISVILYDYGVRED
jgi:hypothetical protein